MSHTARLSAENQPAKENGPTHRILRIDASSRVTGSHSRTLADYFEQQWLRKRRDAEIRRRDLASDPIPHIAPETIAGFYTPPEQMTGELRAATAVSDTLIDELQSADILLLSTPIYNFSVPSALKAWIDQVVRIGKTVAYDGKNFTGLVTGKRAFVICAYGAAGYAGKGPLTPFDHLAPYLKLLLGFIGISDTRVITVEATSADAATVSESIGTANREIEAAVAALP
ncbi:MAG: NAD(P)H-dependent oxidoreductase [Terrimicrobiaceae bacterium]|nr:NAD(P)H-dependent oxidoreductase [Terrimicrobiaceae bacterium]